MRNIPSQKQQLIDYIKKNLAKGYTPDALKYSLVNQGHSRSSIEKAIDTALKQIERDTPRITRTIYTEKNADLIVLDHKPKSEPGLFNKIKSIFKR